MCQCSCRTAMLYSVGWHGAMTSLYATDLVLDRRYLAFPAAVAAAAAAAAEVAGIQQKVLLH